MLTTLKIKELDGKRFFNIFLLLTLHGTVEPKN